MEEDTREETVKGGKDGPTVKERRDDGPRIERGSGVEGDRIARRSMLVTEERVVVSSVAFGRRKLGKIMKEVDTKEWEALVLSTYR